jgi:hypothetical protein
MFLFRAVVGWPGYFVCADGSLWSTRLGNELRRLSTPVATNGYQVVVLCRSENNVIERKTFYLHQLVAVAFLGARSDDHEEIRHLDGVKTNCVVSNLSWGTRKQNAADREAHGRTFHGSAHPLAKLTEKTVLEARRRTAAGESMNTLCKELGVSVGTLSPAVHRKTWKHI